MGADMRTISVVAGCFNEEGNLQEFYDRTVAVFESLPGYTYEIIVADNCSTDGSREILRRIAAADKGFKVIFNSNNFGQVRSPFNALLQASGDAVVAICSDLQTPPELISDFVREWEQGNQVVIAVKKSSRERVLMKMVRSVYYRLLSQMSDSSPIIPDFIGFGLYDRRFMDALKQYHDPYPYFRGLVSEIGFKRSSVEFAQEDRKRGRTKNGFFTLYDVAMTGFVNHSRVPLRLAAFCGFILAGFSLLVALAYLVYKLLFWSTFSLGLAPLVIGVFLFAAVQLIFIGIIGEYVGAILTQVKNQPLVIEEERLNFSSPDDDGLAVNRSAEWDLTTN
jgi:glycosyltransferase involved in cell wall biosynthesis